MTAPLREHTFDGIAEMDNKLPNWWLWTLYLSCIFSVGYWVLYHTLGTEDLPYAVYLAEERAAAERLEAEMARNPVTEQSLLTLAANPAAVAKGQQIFLANCASCHLPNGSGSIGPNLTDAYWLHGGKPMDIHNTILKGYPDKGMQSWANFGPAFVQHSAAYVLTLRNTNVQGKEPQGQKVE